MNKTKLISAAAAAAMLITTAAQITYAEGEKFYVYVTIENNTLLTDDAAWTGEKISRYAVELTADMTAADATKAALEANGYSGAGLDDGWVTELAGLSSSATEMGSWMYSVNDYFGSSKCNLYKPADGDEIVWEYSSLWGSDLGTDYMTADTSLKSIDIEGGILVTEFDGETTNYYLALDKDSETVKIDPLMKNRYFQARIYKNINGTNYDNAVSYHHGEEINVQKGDKITIACGAKGWDTGFCYGETEEADEHIYTLEVADTQSYTVTAPAESTVQVFSQIRNYNTVEIMRTGTEDNGDGTKNVSFALPKKMTSYTYRVSQPGKITKAGYIQSGDSSLTVTFGENENPQIRPQYDTSKGMGKYAEDNLLLNINSQNYLRLNSGDEYKVRAFRAWQIVNTTINNIIIEPDFHYNIISGDSVEIEENGSNAVIKAVKSGVSVVEVTYDAIEIGGNTTLGGVYGAVEPSRKGMFIVNVDGDTSETINMPEWDTEFDTVYFTGDSGTYEFKPSADKELTVLCNDTVIEKNENGTYMLTINEGNNIVSVSCGNTVEYTVIKGCKVKFKDTENGFKLEGLHMPIPKMASVYNPGYRSSVKTVYGEVASKGAQYDFINNNEITVTKTGNLENGVISVTNMGFEKGAHRSITAEGLGANFNAQSYEYKCSILPDVWVSSGNDIFTARYDEKGVIISINKYNHVIESDGADKVFVWNNMQPVTR